MNQAITREIKKMLATREERLVVLRKNWCECNCAVSEKSRLAEEIHQLKTLTNCWGELSSCENILQDIKKHTPELSIELARVASGVFWGSQYHHEPATIY